MTAASVRTAALIGADGHLVTVEADVSHGRPATIIAGLPDTALREARDRVRAAIINSGGQWPHTKITIGLSPVLLPKRGSAFDLAIAIAVLAAAGDLPQPPAATMFLAELGLDGRLRPVPGVLPAVLAATAAGTGTLVVAAANAGEASLAPGITVVAADSLAEVAAWLRGGPPPAPKIPPAPGTSPSGGPIPPPDLADIAGQPEARAAAEICAAGGHGLSLTGPHAARSTMLAERLPTILPRLDTAAALEVTSIYSAAGALPAGGGLITRPPFCAPHHTASKAAITGGGTGSLMPGAVSLAHHGVLFLDQAPEFSRDMLDALRQPLAAGEILLSRSGIQATFPARFILVLAATPCPCGTAATPGGGCQCSPAARRRYLGRLSGPLLDAIDLKIRMEPASRQEILHNRRRAESSAAVAQRVAAARARAARRLAGTPWRLNSQVPGPELRRSYPPAAGAVAILERALELGQLSARGADRAACVAWSIADLAGKKQPGAEEVSLAIGLRR
jgi:magnesium chelatase family protein